MRTLGCLDDTRLNVFLLQDAQQLRQIAGILVAGSITGFRLIITVQF